jgi:hypothetical protein
LLGAPTYWARRRALWLTWLALATVGADGRYRHLTFLEGFIGSDPIHLFAPMDWALLDGGAGHGSSRPRLGAGCHRLSATWVGGLLEIAAV